jgi:hypothetical protein
LIRKQKRKKKTKGKKQNANKQTKKEKQVKSTTIEASIIIVFRLLERFIEMTNKDIFVKTILLWQLMDIK